MFPSTCLLFILDNVPFYLAEKKPIDSCGVRSNISCVATRRRPTVIDTFIKPSSVDESQSKKAARPSIRGNSISNACEVLSIVSVSNQIDFVFPTDETPSTGPTIVKREKNLLEMNEKLNGRVWTEFVDIKQVLAGKADRSSFIVPFFCLRS